MDNSKKSVLSSSAKINQGKIDNYFKVPNACTIKNDLRKMLPMNMDDDKHQVKAKVRMGHVSLEFTLPDLINDLILSYLMSQIK